MHFVKLLGQRPSARDFDHQIADFQVNVADLNGSAASGRRVVSVMAFPAGLSVHPSPLGLNQRRLDGAIQHDIGPRPFQLRDVVLRLLQPFGIEQVHPTIPGLQLGDLRRARPVISAQIISRQPRLLFHDHPECLRIRKTTFPHVVYFVIARLGFQLPTSFVIGLEGSFEADDEICEARESAPEDNCSRWRVVSSGKVAAEAGDGRQVEIEITGLAWL